MTATPILHLKFDEGSGGFAKDSSGSGNHGSIAGTATWVAGKTGKALSFDGLTNYVTLANSSTLQITGDSTICFWIKPTDINVERTLMAKGQLSNEFLIRIGGAGANQGRIACFHGDGSSWEYFLDGTGILTASTWQHVAIVRNNTTKKAALYLNGILTVSNYSYSKTVVSSTNNVYVGKDAGAWYSSFNGLLDCVYIFDRALSIGEIQNLMPVRHAPVLHMRFDEGSGTIASDCSGMGNHGTLVNSPLWVIGKYGKALEFLRTSSKEVTVPDNSTLAFGTGSFSICLWIKSPSTADSIFYGVIGKGQTLTTQKGFAFYRDGSAPTLLRGLVGDGTNSAITTWTNKAVFDNTWHFVCIVADRATQLLKVYVDAVVDSQQLDLSSVGSVTDSNVLRIGATFISEYLTGTLDEVRLFDRALSPSEIMDLYVRAPPKWIIQYNDGTRWVEIPACKFENTQEELNGHEEASFTILNTEENRALVLNDYPVRIYYDYGLVFEGILKAVGYSMTQLQVTCYNQIYETLQKRTVTAEYTDTDADVVLAAITGTGGASTQTFGNTTLESPLAQGEELAAKIAYRVQMLNVSGGHLTDVYVACFSTSGAANAKVAVYTDVDGSPSALLGTSSEVAVGSSMAWHQFTFASPLDMTANAFIWFAIANNAGDLHFAYKTTGGSSLKWNYSMVYGDGFTNPFGAIGAERTGYAASFYGVLSIAASGGGTCPATHVTVKYEKTNAYDAAVGLAKLLGKDFWSSAYFNIGTRNSCVLCLPFEDGSGNTVSDYSGHGNHGTIYPAGGSWSFGRTGTGDQDGACAANEKDASNFTAANSGYLTKISAYVKRSSSGYMRAALYADSAGSPAALIAETYEATVGTGYAWIDFVFNPLAQPSITSGTVYWLALNSAAAFTFRMQSATGNLDYNTDTYSDGYANPFGAFTNVNYEMCIYASGSNPEPTWADGRHGKALSFNGTTNYALVTSTSALTFTTEDFTVAFWAKLTFGDDDVILCKGLLDTAGWYIQQIDVQKIQFATCQAGATQLTIASASCFTNNVWFHCVCVRKGALAYIYVNGVDVTATQPAVINPVTTTKNLHIMVYDGAATLFSTGTLDELHIYNRALSPDEISFLYNSSPYGGASTKRRVDRSKVRSQVIVKGVDTQGNKIEGTAGTGSDVQVQTQIEPASTTTLNDLAAQALAQLSQEGVGSAINYPIHSVSGYKPGDTMPVRIPQLAISDNLRIQKIQKNPSFASVSFEKSISLLENLLKQVQTGNLQQVASRAGVTFTRSLSTSAPSSPVAGDLWYKTDTGAYYFYTGAAWSAV